MNLWLAAGESLWQIGKHSKHIQILKEFMNLLRMELQNKSTPGLVMHAKKNSAWLFATSMGFRSRPLPSCLLSAAGTGGTPALNAPISKHAPTNKLVISPGFLPRTDRFGRILIGGFDSNRCNTLWRFTLPGVLRTLP